MTSLSRLYIFIVDGTLGSGISIYAAISLLDGGSVQGVPFDFTMFLMGILLLLNAKELYE